MTGLELNALFAEAISDWVKQGRSLDQMHGVNNFNTGRGIKLRTDILALANERTPDTSTQASSGLEKGQK